MAAYEMKKCPFCGGGTTQLMEKKNHAEIIYQFVYCLGCFAEGPGVERSLRGSNRRGEERKEMTTKPTPEQRKLINAVRWCRRQADRSFAKRGDNKQHPETCSLYHGKTAAFEDCAEYLNRKLPKELRVKL